METSDSSDVFVHIYVQICSVTCTLDTRLEQNGKLPIVDKSSAEAACLTSASLM